MGSDGRVYVFGAGEANLYDFLLKIFLKKVAPRISFGLNRNDELGITARDMEKILKNGAPNV